MVERSAILNSAYSSLSDPTRRDILMRVTREELPISEIAKSYRMSFTAVAKHVSVLDAAHLVRKRRYGKQQLVSARLETISALKEDLGEFERVWNQRFASLDELLQKTK